MVNPTGIIPCIDGRLYLLGWTRQHPRVQAFLKAVSDKHGENFTLDTAPYKWLVRLDEFLKLYWQCDQVLKKLNLGWDSPIVGELAGDYGGFTNNRQKWTALFTRSSIPHDIFGWRLSIFVQVQPKGVKKMPMLGWRHLYECLENQYFLMDMPKPSDGEPKKAKKKKSLTAK